MIIMCVCMCVCNLQACSLDTEIRPKAWLLIIISIIIHPNVMYCGLDYNSVQATKTDHTTILHQSQ